DSELKSLVYFAISNIPESFRSADLRNYFSQFIESRGFQCFHYRHRPEVIKDQNRPEIASGEKGSSPPTDTENDQETTIGSAKKCTTKSRCCVVAVHAKEADRFVRMYAGNHWISTKGNLLARRCVVRRVKVSNDQDDGSFPYKTKHEQRHRVSLTECFTEADLRNLSEFNPPALMPNGNVGTPVTVFLQLIQSCRLPPRIIRKLGLTFPKTGSNRRYGNVPFHYQDTQTLPVLEETVFTASGHEISGCFAAPAPGHLSDHTQTTDTDEPQKEQEEDQQSNADDDDDHCEEWERHEALHDDVTSQERSKERLYEEEIELKWEKGGSGLVFYTDAQCWQEEEGDFDEQTADDWDVDMSVYYDKDGGDMDARDSVRMRYEKRLREGLEDTSGYNQSIGSFERFTKGFGRRVMEQQGWKDGDGLGHSRVGISEALENEGQHPRCKRGFGYHGEKLLLNLGKKAKTDFYVSTVYDEAKLIDGGDTLLRRQPSTSMKYRG
ncbi:unnamed protein product, partial [Tetraodon nigroviridis]